MRDNVVAEIARAQGVIMTLYGICRDKCCLLVDDDKDGKLGDVISDTTMGLNSVINEYDRVCKEREAALENVERVVRGIEPKEDA